LSRECFQSLKRLLGKAFSAGQFIFEATMSNLKIVCDFSFEFFDHMS